MKKQSTNLGQDREKSAKLAKRFGDLIDEYYPEDNLTGKQLFEVLDALAAITIFIVTSAPKEYINTFKKYYSQRLGEIETQIDHIEKLED